MAETKARAHAAESEVEMADVVIVGAGMSGIGAAWHLAQRLPGLRFIVLEALESFGGTWRVHRYPGIRSDSDLYTYGYSFKPWTGAPLATAEEILGYMGEVIEENDLGRFIRYRHRITAARWDSAAASWMLEGCRTGTGQPFRIAAGFLWMCQGYYRHAEGHLPEWPGMERFGGRIVHAQNWPEDLDLANQRVVVIGAGATAATLVPAIAGQCAHVTLLQRSPIYYRSGRIALPIAEELRELRVPQEWIHEIVRRKIQHEQAKFARRCVTEPEAVKAELLSQAREHLGPDHPLEPHFMPRHRPWQQRIAYIPDGDLFRCIREGTASVVTDTVESFTERGIRLASGQELEADIVVAATGFHLSVLGDIPFEVDGRKLDLAQTVTYRGMMLTGVPNLAWVFGYFRAAWTLRVDLVADFVCRLLEHMRQTGARQVEVSLRPEDAEMPLQPWTDPEDFNPGYLTRGLHLLPKRGAKPEWGHSQDHWEDGKSFPAIAMTDPIFVYR
ncbi:flavin-containing monooxygenase [Sabulicella rubraurantiaca]|uniref:flavin-containing monooxygenase n=1 Tax=Sabulicella rubraurantiaca TaxID=2811429 RepID=UPI001A9782EB|nr:NAD(P)/FAD-dependent oxidoreductase [Sabulicella rubraurantiaca]